MPVQDLRLSKLLGQYGPKFGCHIEKIFEELLIKEIGDLFRENGFRLVRFYSDVLHDRHAVYLSAEIRNNGYHIVSKREVYMSQLYDYRNPDDLIIYNLKLIARDIKKEIEKYIEKTPLPQRKEYSGIANQGVYMTYDPLYYSKHCWVDGSGFSGISGFSGVSVPGISQDTYTSSENINKNYVLSSSVCPNEKSDLPSITKLLSESKKRLAGPAKIKWKEYKHF